MPSDCPFDDMSRRHAWTKGWLAGHDRNDNGVPRDNPYRRTLLREAWDDGYYLWSINGWRLPIPKEASDAK